MRDPLSQISAMLLFYIIGYGHISFAFAGLALLSIGDRVSLSLTQEGVCFVVRHCLLCHCGWAVVPKTTTGIPIDANLMWKGQYHCRALLLFTLFERHSYLQDIRQLYEELRMTPKHALIVCALYRSVGCNIGLTNHVTLVLIDIQLRPGPLRLASVPANIKRIQLPKTTVSNKLVETCVLIVPRIQYTPFRDASENRFMCESPIFDV